MRILEATKEVFSMPEYWLIVAAINAVFFIVYLYLLSFYKQREENILSWLPLKQYPIKDPSEADITINNLFEKHVVERNDFHEFLRLFATNMAPNTLDKIVLSATIRDKKGKYKDIKHIVYMKVKKSA